MTSGGKKDCRVVSVVIPAYNVERYVAEAVESALAQRYQPLEVVVVDDGSSDGTLKVLRQFGTAITVVSQPNGGIGAARNRGVRRARGEVIALLDADDTWHPERAARCMEALERSEDVGFVTTDAALMDDDGHPLPGTYFDEVPFPDTDFAGEIVRRNFLFVGAFIRASALAYVGPFDEGSPTGAEDYDMWLRLIAAGYTPAVVREPLARYRVRPGSLTLQRGGLDRARARALERNLPTYWRQGVFGPANQAMHVAWTLVRRGEFGAARRFIAAAMRDPEQSRTGAVLGMARAGLLRGVVSMTERRERERAQVMSSMR